jgi:uncharacterized protein (DUF3084 family)
MLGGVIATVGDRLGMRVGKARLTLFNLRPRQTATLITILTGGIISASTLAILFTVDDRLRTAVFEFENIQDDLSTARDEKAQLNQQKQQIQRELNRARRQQTKAQNRLEKTNQSLKESLDRQAQTQAQLKSTQEQFRQIQAKFQQAQTLLNKVSQQALSLRSEVQQLQADRQELIRQRDQVKEQIAQRDQEIAQRNQEIAQREAQLQSLEQQRTFLAKEIQNLEQEYQAKERELQGLRQGSVALLRNQPLASGVVRIIKPSAAQEAVDQLLSQANRFAIQRIRPGTTSLDEQVIQIPSSEVEQLVNQIKDGQDYAVRILSASNYVVGEPCVLAGEGCIRVIANAIPNQIVFRKGDVIATTSVDPKNMTDEALAERIRLLIEAAQFRARQAGILPDVIQISDNRRETLEAFYEKVKQQEQPFEIQAIAAEDAYVASAHLELVAIQNGQVLFSTP